MIDEDIAAFGATMTDALAFGEEPGPLFKPEILLVIAPTGHRSTTFKAYCWPVAGLEK
jgi:hypothetical protein